MTTFRPDGFRTVGAALDACADAVEQRGATAISHTALGTWHPQPSQSFEHFRTAWSTQLRSVAGDLRSLGQSANTVADLLTQADEEFGSALVPAP